MDAHIQDPLIIGLLIKKRLHLSSCIENNTSSPTWKSSQKKIGFSKMWAHGGVIFTESDECIRVLDRKIIGSVPVSKFPSGSPVNLLTGYKNIHGKNIQVTDRFWPKEKFEPVLTHLTYEFAEEHVILSLFIQNGVENICAEGKIHTVVCQ